MQAYEIILLIIAGIFIFVTMIGVIRAIVSDDHKDDGNDGGYDPHMGGGMD